MNSTVDNSIVTMLGRTITGKKTENNFTGSLKFDFSGVSEDETKQLAGEMILIKYAGLIGRPGLDANPDFLPDDIIDVSGILIKMSESGDRKRKESTVIRKQIDSLKNDALKLANSDGEPMEIVVQMQGISKEIKALESSFYEAVAAEKEERKEKEEGK